MAKYPPYCSKYNPIEHRLFPHEKLACRGVIFRSLETIRYFMAKAASGTGLDVEVGIIEKVYETRAEVFRIQGDDEDRTRRVTPQVELPRRSQA